MFANLECRVVVLLQPVAAVRRGDFKFLGWMAWDLCIGCLNYKQKNACHFFGLSLDLTDIMIN